MTLTHLHRRPSTALRTAAVLLTAGMALTACSGGGGGGKTDATGETVKVVTAQGETEVPRKPAKVVALDNTSFATLKAFGVKPVAVPKGLLPMHGFEDWKSDPSIADAGSHREPRFEDINATEPDLVIGGYRFASHQQKLSKIAKTVDLAPSDEAAGGYVNSLKTQTEQLGRIFGKETEAQRINQELDRARGSAADATKGESVFLAVASAGKIDNGASRIGRIIEPLHLKNVLAAKDQDSTSVHNNSGLAPETVAKLNPDWMIVLDRDAAVAEKGQQTVAAERLIDGQEAWAKTTFRQKKQVIHLAPDFYVTEGAQAYTEAFDQVAKAFTATKAA